MQKARFILVPGFVLATALAAHAQAQPQPAQQPQPGKNITTKGEMADTLKVTVTGQVVIDYIVRSRELTSFTDAVATGGPGGPAARNEDTFEGWLGVRMDIEMSDKVGVVVEFGTKRVDTGSLNPFADGEAEEIRLREAHLTLSELITTGLKAQIGITTWSFDIRGRGNSFAFDPRHSQTIARNANVVEDGSVGLGTTLADRAGSPDELEPIGAWVTWTGAGITLDFVVLPSVLEGGPSGEDESLYAADLWYSLDQLGKGSRVGAILAFHQWTGGDTQMFTFGGGVVLKEMVPGLELYGELYLQFGDAGKNSVDDTMNAQGMAFQAGAEYRLPNNPMNIWFGGNITIISGGDDNDPTSDDNDFFLSYENVNDLLILEDMYFGLDWDTNYTAFKFSAGATLSLGTGKDNLQVWAILGFARATEDVQFASGTEDALGTEFDIRAKWIITKQVALTGGLGLLFGSKVLEEFMDADPLEDEEEDSATILTFGAELRF